MEFGRGLWWGHGARRVPTSSGRLHGTEEAVGGAKMSVPPPESRALRKEYFQAIEVLSGVGEDEERILHNYLTALGLATPSSRPSSSPSSRSSPTLDDQNLSGSNAFAAADESDVLFLMSRSMLLSASENGPFDYLTMLETSPPAVSSHTLPTRLVAIRRLLRTVSNRHSQLLSQLRETREICESIMRRQREGTSKQEYICFTSIWCDTHQSGESQSQSQSYSASAEFSSASTGYSDIMAVYLSALLSALYWLLFHPPSASSSPRNHNGYFDWRKSAQAVLTLSSLLMETLHTVRCLLLSAPAFREMFLVGRRSISSNFDASP